MVRVIIPDDPAPAAEGVMSGACLWLLITAGDCRRFFGVAERRFCGVMPPKGLAALAAAACCCAAWAWKIVPNHILYSLLYNFQNNIFYFYKYHFYEFLVSNVLRR